MESKIESIKKLIASINKSDDFDPGQYREISMYNSKEQIDSFMRLYQIRNLQFRSKLMTILGIERVSPSEIRQYQELKQRVDHAQAYQGLFSYKQIKRLEYLIFLKDHLPVQEKMGLNIQNDDFRKQISDLKASLKQEGLYQNSQVKKSLGKMIPEEVNTLKDGLQRMKKEIMTIDVDQLKYLTNQTQENKIWNKEGIVFLGKTGSGKSTTILTLLGCEMIEITNADGTKETLLKNIVKHPNIQTIQAGSGSQSVTKSVHAVAIPDKMCDRLMGDEIMLLDTPGFNDTRGSLTDLVNACGTSKAVRGLGKARFVIVFCRKDQMGRQQGFVKLIQTLNQVFPSYQNIKKSVTFLFNRFPSNDNDIKSKLNGLKNAPSLSSANTQSILSDMIAKTSKFEQILFYDPLNKDIKYAKNCLQRILKSTPTSALHTVYQLSLTEEVSNDIGKEVQILQQLCLNYYQQRKISTSKYYLSQILDFIRVLQSYNCPEKLLNSIHKIQIEIQKILSTKYEKVKQFFNRSFKSNTLLESNVDQYFQEIQKCDSYVISNEHNKIPDYRKELLLNINQTVDESVKGIERSALETKQEAFKILIMILKRLQRQDAIKRLREVLEKNLEYYLKQYQRHVTEWNLQAAVQNYKQHRCILKLYSCLNPDLYMYQHTINTILSKSILFHRQSMLEMSRNLFELTQEKYKRMAGVLGFVSTIQKSPFLMKQMSNCEDISNSINIFINEIQNSSRDYFIWIQSGFSRVFDENSRKRIVQMNVNKDAVKSIPYIKDVAVPQMTKIDQRIKNCLAQEMKTIVSGIDALSKECQEGKFKNFKRSIQKLNSRIRMIQQMIFDYHEDMEMEEVTEKVDQLYDEILSNVSEIKDYNSTFESKDIEPILETLLIADCVTQSYCSLHKRQADSKQFLKNDLPKTKVQSLSSPFQTNSIHNSVKQIHHAYQLLFKKCSKIIIDSISSLDKINKEQNTQSQNLFNYNSTNICVEFLSLAVRKFCTPTNDDFKQFSQYLTKFESKIQIWFNKFTDHVCFLFKELKTCASDQMRRHTFILKKKINFFLKIEKQDGWVHRMMKYSTTLKEVIQNDIRDLFQYYEEIWSNKQQGKLLTANSRMEFRKKCSILSGLDEFCDYNPKFSKLLGAVEQTEKLHTNRFSTNFQQLMKNKSYKQALQELIRAELKLSNQAFEDMMLTFERKLVQQISLMSKPLNGKQDVLEQIIKELVAYFQTLAQLQKEISRSTLASSKQMISILNGITQFKKVSQSLIQKYSTGLQHRIKSNIDNQMFERASKQLNKGKAICKQIMSSPALQSILNSKMLSHYQIKIADYLSTCHSKYVKNLEKNINGLKVDLENLFIQPSTLKEFETLKKAIEKNVLRVIQQAIELLDGNIYTDEDLKRLNKLVRELPSQLKQTASFGSLQTLIRQQRSSSMGNLRAHRAFDLMAYEYQIERPNRYFQIPSNDRLATQQIQANFKKCQITKLNINPQAKQPQSRPEFRQSFMKLKEQQKPYVTARELIKPEQEQILIIPRKKKMSIVQQEKHVSSGKKKRL